MSFDDLGLIGAIENLIDVLNNRFVIDIQADINFSDDFDELRKLEIYRVIQECLTNSAKHANAKKITLTIYDKGNDLYICTSDDGIGIPEQEKENESKDDKKIHYGLQIMKERVSILNGRCYINSIKNEGTKIEIIIPR
jgi:signal transduction histidine kinase